MSKELDNIRKLIECKGVQFRDFHSTEIETREASGEEPEKMIIRGLATPFEEETLLMSYRNWDGKNVEVYESVHRDAFDEADMSDVIFNYNHGGRVYARTRNESLKLNINKSRGLEMETELWNDDEGHCQMYRDVKRGNIDRMSYAFITGKVDERKEIDEDENVVRYHYTIMKVRRVLDVSAVDIPAYDATEISARRWIEAGSLGKMSERQAEFVPAESQERAAAESGGEDAAKRRFELERKILLAKLGGR